jgi:hypothetical protein
MIKPPPLRENPALRIEPVWGDAHGSGAWTLDVPEAQAALDAQVPGLDQMTADCSGADIEDASVLG